MKEDLGDSDQSDDCILIDWQMVAYGNPTDDLALLMITSLDIYGVEGLGQLSDEDGEGTLTKREQVERELLRVYARELIANMADLELDESSSIIFKNETAILNLLTNVL